MAFPRDEGVLPIFPTVVDKTAMETKKTKPTTTPTFQPVTSKRPARAVQERKVAARHAGQGTDRTQKVFRDRSRPCLFHSLAVATPIPTRRRAIAMCIATPMLMTEARDPSGISPTTSPMTRDSIRYNVAMQRVSFRLRLARPHPKLTFSAKMMIPISTPDAASHVKSKDGHQPNLSGRKINLS